MWWGDGVSHLQFPAMQPKLLCQEAEHRAGRETAAVSQEVAEIEIRGGVDLELRAIDWYYRTWLPTSGYVPTDQPGFEAFVGRPFAHGDEYFELRAQFPVMRA